MGSVNVKKGVDRALYPTFLIIGTVTDISLGCKKNGRPHPRNPQNAFYRPHLHDVITQLSQKSTFSKLITLHTNITEILYRSILTIAIADTIYWHHVISSSQIYVFIADTPYFLWENKNKLLFDFQVFVFDNLLSFYI